MKSSIFFCAFSMIVIVGLMASGCSDEESPSENEPGNSSGFTIGQTDDYTFPECAEGYAAAPNSRSVRVTNTGSSALSVSIALGGTNPGSFTLNRTTLNLEPEAFGTFTVVPKTGLKKNTYTATVTVSAAGLTPKSFNVSFKVEKYDFSITQSDHTFTAVNPITVSVKNERDTAINVTIALSGTNSGSFSLSATSLPLPASGANTFTVVPKNGLAEGTYTATVTISAGGYNASFKVSFEVETLQEEKHLYIAFGQSNMQGPGEAQAQDQNDVPERFQTLNVVGATYAYGNTVVPNVTPNGGKRDKGEWYKAVPPNIINGTNPQGSSGTRVGLSPVDYFGRTMAAGAPEHVTTIGVVAVAFGDLALSSFRKTGGAAYFSGTGNGGTVTLNGATVTRTSSRPSSTERQGWRRITTTTENINGDVCIGGYASFYDAIVTNVKLAQSQGYIVKGIIFHQGESGRGLEDKTWVLILKEIYDDILADCELAADSIPILCGQQFGGGTSASTSTGNTGDNGILNTDNRIQSTIPKAWVIDSAGLANRGDGIHFSTQGIRDLGTRFGKKMLELVYGITE